MINKERNGGIKYLLIVGVLFLSILACTSETSEDYVPNEVYQALIPVCQGEGVPEAKEFDPNAEVHKTIVMTEDGKYWKSRYGLRDGWTATSVAETELVICIGEQESINAFCGDGMWSGLAGRKASIRLATTGEYVRGDNLAKKYGCGDTVYEELKLPAIKEWLLGDIKYIEKKYRENHPE